MATNSPKTRNSTGKNSRGTARRAPRTIKTIDVPGVVEQTPTNAMVTAPAPDVVLSGGAASPAQSSASSTPGAATRQWNRWRERYNPLRGLNIARCVTLCEQYQRGEMADPQWVYFFIEQTDPDLFAIIERRESAIVQLDWEVKPVNTRWGFNDPRNKSFDSSLAEEQAQALREAYEGVDNLYEAISHLQLATFRGFAHVEKHRNADGDVYHLELVDQWNMVRDLLRGGWKYNPDALATTFYGLPEKNLIDPRNFLIREKDRHVNRIALLKFIRANLSEKDWDAFIEIYGIPSGVVIGPLNVSPQKEDEYRNAARDISQGGSGYLPNGSQYIPNDSPRNDAPFRPRLDYLTEKLVLAGTGGLLTMLTQSGSGTLAGSAHMEAFDMIARSEARKISEVFNRQFDTEILDRLFPGKQILCKFEISAHDEMDPDKVAEHAVKYSQAGYRISAEELSEKSGYQLMDAQAEKDPTDDVDPTDDPDDEDDAEGVIANRLREISLLPDDELPAAVAAFTANELLPLCNRITADPAKARRIYNRVTSNLLLPKHS